MSDIADISEGGGDTIVPQSEDVEANTDRPRRVTKLTKKGRQMKLATLQTFMKTLEKRMNKQMTLMDTLLTSCNIDVVNTESANLDRHHTELADGYARFIILMEEGEADGVDGENDEFTAVAVWMEAVDSHYYAFKQKVLAWLLQQEKDALSERRSVLSRRSDRSKSSSVSRRSKASSVDSKRSVLSLQQKAKIAGLKAEAEAIKITKEAELNADLKRLEQEIKKAEAMDKVYTDTEIKKTEAVNQVFTKADVLGEKKCNQQSATKDLDHASSSSPSNIELQIAMMQMMRLQSAPSPDLDCFSGDPLEYAYFKETFKEVVESAVTDQRGRLMRLIKYTSSDAKELIKHLVHGESHDCYDRAVSLLDKEYGNPHLMTCSYLKQLRHWPVVRQNDAVGYKKYYHFLLKCQTYKSRGRLQELDSTDMIRTIISKTHQRHQDGWNRRAIEIRRKHGKEACFLDVVNFMEMESSLLNDPAYSRDAFIEASSIKSYATDVSEERVKVLSCPACKLSHDLEDCNEYLDKDVAQRNKFVSLHKLCFGCLSPTNETHFAKKCAKKRKCKVCNVEHPTTLHGSITKSL